MADPVVVPSPHAEAAKAVIAKIRALRADVPRFIADVPEERRRLATKASLTDAFLESASVSIQTSALLENASGTDATTLRDSFSFALAWDSVVQEALAFARSVAHTIRVERAKAGSSALDIYAMAQRFSRRKDGAELVPHVQDMRRKLKRGRRKSTSDPAPDPAASQAP